MKALAPFVFALCAAFAVDASAQAYPSKPIRLVVTYPPGGGADLMARLIAPKMAETLGQPVIVDNKAGAGGQIGAAEVARAAPDGYTIMLDAANHAVNPALYENKLPYDARKTFQAISLLVRFPNVLVVTPSFPAKDVQELIAMAKAKPGTIAFASSGNGSAQHLAAELFRQKAGVEMTHIPYKGGGPALNDVIGGQVPVFFANMASGLPHVKGGKLRALAITGAKRSPALPEAPTMTEAGLAGYEVYEWNAVFAPPGTPSPIILRLSEAITKAMQSQDVQERVASLGGEIAALGPAETARFVREQTELWGRVVRAGGIRAE
jgi:tripartite-type tricarboxylate transporter receptor subunit TctC